MTILVAFVLRLAGMHALMHWSPDVANAARAGSDLLTAADELDP